ncbi:MAG: branched-chain amino acid ABC transporter permease [Thaumarchaeota archaeon]|nr:branched-chain amino acid ABC transporter permease [Candidatus Calditenuaceae archaeon]MCX8203265.1 branched-chain amino acid ABC transporter permease [Nitrososphaeria archaeon]MDW8043279.1 branched-chain amino acid ABC transporter permease [Nitrososphaerota archaeon]
MIDAILYQAFTGLFRSSYYWLIASGLTLIFGVTRVVNFAHATFFVLGGYTALTVHSLTGNFVLSVLGSAALVALVGLASEVALLRPLYRIENLYQLLMTFALTLIINDASKIIWGPESRSLPLPRELSAAVYIGPRPFPLFYLVVIGLAFATLALLYYLIERTFWGLKVKATWRDLHVAEALRIDSRGIFSRTFMLGSFLAGLGGAFMVAFTPVAPGLGDSLIIVAFVIVVIAGLGNLLGAFISSMIIGVSESLFIMFVPEVDILLIFVIMTVVLLVRPWGIFGER